jgi:hypothetical protein
MYAIWQPMLPTDWFPPTAGVLARLSDGRVTQYWDPDHRIAKRISADAAPSQRQPDCCENDGILWDVTAVYAPDATWTDRMPPAVFINGPVVAVADDIARTVKFLAQR